jgi:WhiB family transcriptional regulator, redox-sensing transcriptional regulator
MRLGARLQDPRNPPNPTAFLYDGSAPCVEHAETFEAAGDALLKTAIIRAAEICGRCPFKRPCRVHAIRVREPWGVWGGMSPDDREQFNRDRARRRIHAQRKV